MLELSGPNSSVATKIDQDGPSIISNQSCMVVGPMMGGDRQAYHLDEVRTQSSINMRCGMVGDGRWGALQEAQSKFLENHQKLHPALPNSANYLF